jgi:hypothetical protein
VILYSIIPPEIVFQGFQENGSGEGKRADIFEAYYRGEKVLVTKNAVDRFEIVRLLSTCPKSFLNENFQPGHVIEEWELMRTSN